MIARKETGDEADKHFKHLDFSGFTFPSDGLTIGALREKHRELFDKGFSMEEDAQPRFFFDPTFSGEIVANILFCERLVATCAYAEARGMRWPDCEIEGIRGFLLTHYPRYGLASGPQHAEQLIRDIEGQGTELAKQRRALRFLQVDFAFAPLSTTTVS